MAALMHGKVRNIFNYSANAMSCCIKAFHCPYFHFNYIYVILQSLLFSFYFLNYKLKAYSKYERAYKVDFFNLVKC